MDYWRDVLRSLEAAPIGTFHTFCGEVVRRFAARAGVDPGFAILDESVAATCREDAVDAALRRALVARDADLRAILETYDLGTIREHLVGLLADRSAESLDAWARADPAELVEAWRAAFHERGRPAAIATFLDAARPCLEMIETRREGFPPKMREALAVLAEGLGAIATSDRPETILEEVREAAKMPRGVGPAKWPDPLLYEPCKATFEDFRDLVTRTQASIASDDASTALAAQLGVSLARVAAKARAEFAAAKRRRGALDFDDLLLITRDLLREGDGAVCGELVRQFDLILVDEFQDTDTVQDEIVRRIAGDDLAGGRLFLVGDVEAVDLWLPRSPARPVRALSRRVPRRGPAAADRELPQPARGDHVRQRPVRRRVPEVRADRAGGPRCARPGDSRRDVRVARRPGRRRRAVLRAAVPAEG